MYKSCHLKLLINPALTLVYWKCYLRCLRNRWTFLSLIKSAEQLSTEGNDDSDKDIGDHGDDSDIDNGDCTNGDRETTKKQVSNTAIEKQELEQPENPKEQEPDKKMIREWVTVIISLS